MLDVIIIDNNCQHSSMTAQDALTALLEAQNQTGTGTETTATKDVNIIYEHQQYYYHPDHLGSSSFVTDEKGKVYEHLEYFPFGETFGHEHSNTQRTPYRFTGKEYDEVTGLYYYGARYYDPRTSVWQSPDPILESYMNGKTNGGVFNPKNLSLFSYTYNNPVNLVDPNGNAVDPRLKITGAAAMYDSDVTSHNYSVEETDAAFETMGMVLGLGGLVKHFAGDMIKSAGKSITEGIQSLFKSRKLVSDNPLTGKVWNTQKAITENVSKSLTRSQNKIMKAIDEKIHNFEARNTLSGDNLDDGHINKLKSYSSGLTSNIKSLQNSLNNPKLSNEVRSALEGKIDIAQKMENRINTLLQDK